MRLGLILCLGFMISSIFAEQLPSPAIKVSQEESLQKGRQLEESRTAKKVNGLSKTILKVGR